MIGWGTTYHLPVILGETLSRDLGLPMEVIFGGLSVMLIVCALLSPRVGAMIDQLGPGRFLIAGSLFASAGLVILSQARGLFGYAAAWVFFGLVMTTMLSSAALVALARAAGRQARSAITIMLLFTACNPFIFYPVTSHLAGAVGWRTTLLIYAALHLLVSLPANILVGRIKPAAVGDADAAQSDEERHGLLPAGARPRALLLVMIAFSAQGLIGWGVQPNIVNILAALGLPLAGAIFLASLHGPSQLAGRMIDFGSRGQMSPLTMGLIASALAPFGLLVMIYAGVSQIAAVISVGLFGMSAGLNSIIRASIPLHLFGREAYGATLGRIALPMNAACAVAPILFAAIITHVGPVAGLLAGAAVGFCGLAVMARLAQETRAAVAAPAATPAE